MRGSRRASAVAASLIVALLATWTASCAHDKEREEAEEKRREDMRWNGRQIGQGEVVAFDFEGDGEWHKTPFLAFDGDKIQIVPSGMGRAVAAGAIQFRIGRSVQIINSEQAFAVTQPGPIAFRLDRRKAPGYSGTLSVEIRRIAEVRRRQ